MNCSTGTMATGSAAGQPAPVPAGGRITSQWRLSFDALLAALEKLPAMTEQRFLKVGAMLEEISARLRTVGAGADRAARMMSGGETLSVVTDMELLLDRLEDDFLAADRTAAQVGRLLGGILGELRDMDRLMESFKGHVGNLRMLKLLTNIQGASLAERGVGFRKVADDIGVLAQNIDGKSTAILSRVRTLNAELVKGRDMVAALGVAQQQLNRKMAGAVRGKIALLAEMHGNCSVAARDLSSRSGEISRHVGAIVVSLQFQDITRQQMEHAREALAGVRLRVAAEGASATAGILPAELAGICALQSAQLASSADELVAAVSGIDSGLQGVAREAAASSARVHGLFQQADGIGRSSLADIELGLNSLLKAFSENLAVRESFADIILATTAAMGEITGFAGEIDLLGSEIRLIALNAIIKAVQAGKDGAAFSVIAETVKQQSDDICRQAATINTTIQTVTRHVDDLRRETLGEDESTSLLRTDELATAVARLKGLITAAGELLLGTDQAADSLADTIHGATAALASTALVAFVGEELRPRLELLAVGLLPGVQAAGQGGWSAGVKGAERRYTMGSERAVHQKFLGGVVVGGREGKAGDDHFAANVEFF